MVSTREALQERGRQTNEPDKRQITTEVMTGLQSRIGRANKRHLETAAKRFLHSLLAIQLKTCSMCEEYTP